MNFHTFAIEYVKNNTRQQDRTGKFTPDSVKEKIRSEVMK